MNRTTALLVFLSGLCFACSLPFNIHLQRHPKPSLANSTSALSQVAAHDANNEVNSHAQPEKSFTDLAIEFFVGYFGQFLEKRDAVPVAVSTTTQPATVDIKTLPGYWLKDPTVSEPSPAHQVDYRTESYRLDDLLDASTEKKAYKASDTK